MASKIGAIRWEITATHKQNPDASSTVWDDTRRSGWERLAEGGRLSDYFVTTSSLVYTGAARGWVRTGDSFTVDGGEILAGLAAL
jgi:hypothetical protein